MKKFMRRPLIAYKRNLDSYPKECTNESVHKTRATDRLISLAKKTVTTILFMAKTIHTTEEQTGHGLLLKKSMPAAPNTITINITGMSVEEVLKVKLSLQPGKFKHTTAPLMINVAEDQDKITTQSTTIEIEGVVPQETGIPVVDSTVDIKKSKKRS